MIYDHWSFIFAGKGKAKQLEQSYDWQSNRQDGWLGFVFIFFWSCIETQLTNTNAKS